MIRRLLLSLILFAAAIPLAAQSSMSGGANYTGTAPIVVSGTTISCPTCGTSSGTVTSVSGTANQIDVATGTTTPVISLDAAINLPGTLDGYTITTCTSCTLTLANSKTFTVSNTLTLSGTDGASINLSAIPNGNLANSSVTINSTGPLTGGGAVSLGGTLTLACATCVTASSPGAGIAHFAGSTQAVTSSAVNLANTDVTGTLPIANGGTNANTGVADAVPNSSSTSAATWSQTPTLGAAGGSTGVINYNGSTSGSATAGCVGATCTAFGGTGQKAAFASYSTGTNCAGVGTSASPSVVTCTSAAAGAFSCATNASAGTCTINTTAITANSEIIVQAVADEGTRLSVTCNTAPTSPPVIVVATKTGGTGFTINLPTFTTNPVCYNYWVVN